MKKGLRILLLTGVLAVLLCVTAFAAESPGKPGIYNLNLSQASSTLAVQITPQTADGTDISAASADINGATVAFYQEAVKLKLTYAGATANNQYVVFLLRDITGIPTQENIAYIDQSGAGEAGVSFTLYPDKLEAGTTYGIYLSSNTDSNISGLTQVATFQYYAAYKPGDVNKDDIVNVEDAQSILDHITQKRSLNETGRLAADVEANGKIDVGDVQRILDYIVKRITEF